MKRTMIFSFVLAVATALIAYVYLSSLENKYKTIVEPTKIVVAMQRIPQGTAIQPHMVTEKHIPKGYVQPKAFHDKKELFTGEGVPICISSSVIEENEQILSTKVSKTNQDIGISSLIPDGKKAVVVNFDIGTSSVLTPGTKIDIFSITECRDSNNKFQKSVFTIAQNVLILAVGNSHIGGAIKKQEGEAEGNNTVILAVSVEEAKKIFLAAEGGVLKYAIRPVGDVKLLETQPLEQHSFEKPLKVVQQKDTKFTNQQEILEIIDKYAKTREID